MRAQIDELRRTVNARLADLSATIDRLMPAVEASASPPAAPTEAKNPTQGAAGTASKEARRVRIGQDVYVPRLGGSFTVVEVAPSGQTFKVQSGAVRVQLRVDEVWSLEDPPAEQRAATKQQAQAKRSAYNPVVPELDLHGFTENEALTTLEIFLHHEYMRHTGRVRIIHGKGTGTLRAAVRRELKRNPLVRSIDTGPHLQGDDGVTVANLDV